MERVVIFMEKIRKISRKSVILMLTLIIALSPILNTIPVNATSSSILTAQEIMRDMGTGFNIGNSLDSSGDGSNPDVYKWEQAWGNPVITKEFVDTIKEKGFNTVRIPVTWFEHISNDGSYTIDERWLSRVADVIGYAIDNDMYVIINVHHEPWINRSDFTSGYNSISPELKAVWRQIAEYFSDYDQHLIFEGMNEPRISYGEESVWVTDDVATLEVLNKLNADFVDTVRSVYSPYQYTRLLMIPGYAASADKSVYEKMVIPGGNDSNGDGYDDYVAISIHAYKPFDFAMGDGDHSVFSDADESELQKIMYDIWFTFVSKGIPVVIGEYSASNYGYNDARVKWARAYMTYAKELGIPCVLWDNNKERNDEDPSEAHGYIDRNNNKWTSSGGLVVNQLIRTYNDESIVWGSGIVSTREHDSLSADRRLSVEPDSDAAFITKNGLSSVFTSDKEIAITFNSSIPTLELMDSSWDGYMQVEPDDYGKVGDKYVAYFSISSIISAWNDKNSGKEIWSMKVPEYVSNGCSSYLLTYTNEPPQAEEEKEVTFSTHSLTLGDEIGVNFYMIIPEEARGEDAYITFSTSGKNQNEVTIPVSEGAVQSDGRIKFTYRVNSLQMADTITAIYHYGINKTVTETYSIKTYIDCVLASDKASDELKELVIKIANYGHYAQIALAESNGFVIGIDYASMPAYGTEPDSSVDLSRYNMISTGKVNGIKRISMSLSLNTRTMINLYFTVDSSYTTTPQIIVKDSSGQVVSGILNKQADGRYRLSIPNISAHKLAETYTVCVDETLEINVSTMSYAYSALSISTINDATKDMVASLYEYYVATMNYIDSIAN